MDFNIKILGMRINVKPLESRHAKKMRSLKAQFIKFNPVAEVKYSLHVMSLQKLNFMIRPLNREYVFSKLL